MSDLKLKAREVSGRGYCVLESAYDDKECEQIRTIFKGLCDKKGGFSPERPSISFHPFLEWRPEMAPFFAKSDCCRCNGGGLSGRRSACVQRGCCV